MCIKCSIFFSWKQTTQSVEIISAKALVETAFRNRMLSSYRERGDADSEYKNSWVMSNPCAFDNDRKESNELRVRYVPIVTTKIGGLSATCSRRIPHVFEYVFRP